MDEHRKLKMTNMDPIKKPRMGSSAP